MRSLSVRIVALLGGAALWAALAGQAQAQQNRNIVLGSPAYGSRPVTIAAGNNFSSWRPIAYSVDNTLWPRLPSGYYRTHTPSGSRGIRVQFHNGSPEGRFASYRLYGGTYQFRAPRGILTLQRVRRLPAGLQRNTRTPNNNNWNNNNE
jgi:hypothetical protein